MSYKLKKYAGRSLCCLWMVLIAVHGSFQPGSYAETVKSGASDTNPEEKAGLKDPAYKTTDELLRDLTRSRYRQDRRLEYKSTDELMKFLVKKVWYKYRSADDSEKPEKKEASATQDDEDLSSIKKGASKEIKSVVILLGEIPVSNQRPLYGPVFMTDQSGIFGTKTDFSFSWVGLKTTMKFTQKKFPWDKMNLQETFIGSFLYASGTNFGISSGKLHEENRFYTNYFSEILALKYYLPYYFATGFALDSRQYFFVKRNTPADFNMPSDHVNIFPRFDLSYERMKERGIDQLTEGFDISYWIGYGIRNRWDSWGEPGDLQSGENARKFMIQSLTVTAGLLFLDSHNIVLRARYKGGENNDFLTRPRFGGTIDNAKIDVVHGFSLDTFRVNDFGLVNFRYSFDIFSRLRMNLFFDYAHIFSPHREEIAGSGYGFRILFIGGLPIWVTHGIGRRLYPERLGLEQVVMIMTAAGW
jgi:hypothetical protein